jgi:uncharacterized protein YjbI with pentapeptide repeats
MCTADGCTGAVAADGRCLAHLDETAFEGALHQMRTRGELNAQGVTFTDELLGRVIRGFGWRNLAHVHFESAIFEDAAAFTSTTFEGRARFNDAIFKGTAAFAGAVFKDSAIFDGARFEAAAVFGRDDEWGQDKVEDEDEAVVFERRGQFCDATFVGRALFGGTRFGDHALFDTAVFEKSVYFADAGFAAVLSLQGATVPAACFDWAEFVGDLQAARAQLGDTDFRGATFASSFSLADAILGGTVRFPYAKFKRDASFEGCRFPAEADFTSATFGAGARFAKASFGGPASFESAVFGQDVDLRDVQCRDAISFRRATFERARELSQPCARTVCFDEAAFREPVRLELATARATFTRTKFEGGATMRLRWADVVFEETELGRPTILARGTTSSAGENELRETLRGDPRRTEQPRVVSLRDTNVGELTLSGVDVSACRFAGAINLDRLRLENPRFGSSPKALTSTDRRVIAEERDWRASRGQWPRESTTPPGESPPDDVDPRDIAGIYRGLRKGREDLKDEPGAADFYYGEMEMRRHGTSSRAERIVLFLYWLVSGYGLRTSRALTGLLVTVVVFAFLFDAWGFEQQVSLGTAFLFSLESTTSLLRGPDRALTGLGETLWIVLRLLGPAFFGLALLSLRGRIKR